MALSVTSSLIHASRSTTSDTAAMTTLCARNCLPSQLIVKSTDCCSMSVVKYFFLVFSPSAILYREVSGHTTELSALLLVMKTSKNRICHSRRSIFTEPGDTIAEFESLHNITIKTAYENSDTVMVQYGQFFWWSHFLMFDHIFMFDQVVEELNIIIWIMSDYDSRFIFTNQMSNSDCAIQNNYIDIFHNLRLKAFFHLSH